MGNFISPIRVSYSGKILLAAMLALFSQNGFAAGGACVDDPTLTKMIVNDIEKKCAKNKDVPANVENKTGDDAGACEGVYKSSNDAIKDLLEKERAKCEKVQASGKEGEAKCQKGGAKECIDSVNGISGEAKKIESQKAAAAQKLEKWVEEKKQNAKKALSEIKDKKEKIAQQAMKERPLAKEPINLNPDANTGKLRKGGDSIAASLMERELSSVTEALQKEQENAIAHGQQVQAVLKKKAAESAVAQSQLDKMSKTTGKDGDNMKSTPTGKESETGTQTAAKPEEKPAGAGGGMPSMPSPPGGGDKGGNEMAGDTSGTKNDLGDTATPSLIGGNELATGKSKSDPTLNATPGNTGSTEEVGVIKPNISSGASSISDTSLRDSLKKKLLGQQAEAGSGEALGGMPFGGAAGKGKTAKSDLAPLAMPHFGGGDSGGGGGAGDAGDFSMARSETEEAVSHLLNEFTQPGNAGLENGRDLADIEHGGLSSLEGTENTPIFTRVRGTIVRYLKKGRVVNGVNGKI